MALNKIKCLLIAMFISACSSKTDGTTYEVGKVKYVLSFPEQIEMKGKEINLVPQSYGSGWIGCIMDTTLILVNPDGTNGYLHAYSTNKHEYLSSFVKKGRGPGEYPNFPRSLSTELSNMLCLADSYTGETVYKNLDSLIKFGSAAASPRAPSNVYDKGFSSLEYIDGSIRVLKRVCFSPNKKAILSYDVFHDTTMLREIGIFDFTDSKNMGLDATGICTAYSPVNKKLFGAFCHFNQINVYSLSGDTEFTICVSKEKKLYSQQDFDNTSRVTKRYFYDSAVCSDKYLFALYYDLPAVDYEMNNEAFPVIQVFTIDGKPVAELLVKEKLSDIEFDPVHNRLYGFTGNEELLYYDLNGIGLK